MAQAAPRINKGRVIKRIALAFAPLASTATDAHHGHNYWTTIRFVQSTDDVFVKTDYTMIAPKVARLQARSQVADLTPILAEIRASGAASLREMAADLNEAVSQPHVVDAGQPLNPGSSHCCERGTLTPRPRHTDTH